MKAGASALLPALRKLFNLIFSSGIYPKDWSNSYILPLFKSGDKKLPENYRGIAIGNSLGKLFNLILNSRLDKYFNKNSIINEYQIGFSKKARTSDHIFVLRTIIDKYTKQGGKLYACFVDFKKAFDTVIHAGIRFKLLMNNINGKFYKIIKSMYERNEVCIKVNNNITPHFMSQLGVRQGDVMSPNLFKIFINDLPKYFTNLGNTVEINNKKVDCLMYADDIVLLSTTASGLQSRLDQLHCFCNEWCLQVNTSKTKVMIFNNSGRLLKSNFSFDNKYLDVVKNYKYLGITFSPNGLFHQAKSDLYNKAMKASFKLQKSLSSCNPSVKTFLHLFDHTIKPIVLYGCEIWGMFNTTSAKCRRPTDDYLMSIYFGDYADKIHLKVLKHILGVHKRSNNVAVLSEMGRFPIYFTIVLSVIKYLHRLETLSNGLLYDAFICNKNLHAQKVQTWYSSTQYLLDKLNINSATLTKSNIQYKVNKEMRNIFLNFWKMQQMKYKNSDEGKLDTYYKVKDCFRREKYLDLKHFNIRQSISKLRLSAHSLKIETGRFGQNRLSRKDRICDLCSQRNIENEMHFLIDCPFYSATREPFWNVFKRASSNFENLTPWSQFLWLVNNEESSVLKSLGTFIDLAFTLRKEKLLSMKSV